jgi:hypothetical protein
MRRVCYTCEKRPARRLKTRAGYCHAAEGAMFCSIRCAADYGLLQAEVGEAAPTWCRKHGWFHFTEGDGCPHCNAEEEEPDPPSEL